MPDVVKYAKTVKGFLDHVGDSDHLQFHGDIVRLSQYAKPIVGAVGSLAALAVAGRFGYEKWRHHKDQRQRLIIVLLSNRLLLRELGEEGRQKFIINLRPVLVGETVLDRRNKIQFIQAMTKDEPVDPYGMWGGLGLAQHNDDGAITKRLSEIQQELEPKDPDLAKLLVGTVSFIHGQMAERARKMGR